MVKLLVTASWVIDVPEDNANFFIENDCEAQQCLWEYYITLGDNGLWPPNVEYQDITVEKHWNQDDNLY